MNKRALNILVLAGGDSTEREVSLNSSKAVAETLQKHGHQVRLIDTLNGAYLNDSGTGGTMRAQSEPFPQAVLTKEAPVIAYPLALELSRLDQREIDVVFIGLHGGTGENGTIQAFLDLVKLPYTGSGPAASAIAMNKDISKRVMQSLGIPTAEWRRFDADQKGQAKQITGALSRAGLEIPLVVKPTDGGSTVGLTLVETKAAMNDAISAAFGVADSVMVERYFKGREITISVLDGAPLPPIEIKPTHKLYDYTCKYTKGKSEYICPADIPDELTARLSADAVLLYKTIGCRGYARVDFIAESADNYICLELNTLPGMTGLSLFPMAARAAGIEFDELLVRLCRMAMERK